MLGHLKERLFGKQVWAMPVPGNKKSEVYLWERNGRYSLRIWSERGSYAQGPGMNWMAVWFEPDQIPALMNAVASAEKQLRLLSGKEIRA